MNAIVVKVTRVPLALTMSFDLSTKPCCDAKAVQFKGAQAVVKFLPRQKLYPKAQFHDQLHNQLHNQLRNVDCHSTTLCKVQQA